MAEGGSDIRDRLRTTDWNSLLQVCCLLFIACGRGADDRCCSVNHAPAAGVGPWSFVADRLQHEAPSSL